MAKRFIASLLTLCIMLSLVAMVPSTALATTDEPTASTTETVEPQTTETVDYYLFGYINGANYGCEEDHENMGAYKFVNGSLKVQFTADSYIGIKTTGNANWYMTKTYVSGTSGTFFNTNTGASEKMLIPANKDVTLTLKVNTDGSLTVSYVAVDPVCEHTYTSKVTVAANCLNAGVKTYTCSKCGDKYTEAIPATGHTNKVVVTAATCQTYASYALTCTACGNKEVIKTEDYLMKGMESIPNGMDAKLFTNEPLYRYRTQTVLTSLESTMEGYTQIGTEWIDGGSDTIYYVKSWPTGFDTASSLYTKYNNVNKKVAAYENTTGKLTVNSDKVVGYLYYHWCYEGHPEGWSTAEKEGKFVNFNAFYSTVAPSEADKHDPTDMSYRFDGSDCENSKWWFVVEVYGQNYTRYDKQYIFGKWSEWTEWSTTPATSSANREVETITGYRFISADLADHNYKNGFCTYCNVYDPDNIGYHLIGYINGADYGCESDYETVGIYRFNDGKLTATFTKDSYVFIKTSDNENWYMASSFVNGTIGIFTNTKEGSTEKMFVPANFEITFTLVENKDGSLSLSYVAKEPVCNHSYSSKVTTAVTCTTDGLKTFTCSKCGHIYSETIKATGHVNDCVVTEATCAEYAKYDLTCTVCGFNEVLKADELLMKGLDSVPNGMDPKLFTNQPLYRYRTHKTATSYEETMEGYTPIGTTWVEHTNNTIYYVKSWPAGFDKTNVLYSQYNNISKKVTASETEKTKLEINSDKVVGYLYYHWCYPEHEKDWSTAQKEGLFVNFSAFYSTIAPSNYRCDYTDMSYKVGYDNCDNSDWWFVVEVYGQNYSEYDLQNAFESWSDWSEWSTTAVTATANREVETITGYRLISATKEDHDYSNGLCTVCGAADPGNIGYHLIGYINGKNYGCEEDHENVGTYRFINGKLTVKFTEESYVFIKTSDNVNWYMAQTYISGTTGKFFSTSTGTGEKMRIPGNVEVTLTLVANADGSLTLSYVTGTTCTHTYTSKVTTAATCTKEGVKTFTCSKCGHSYTEKIAVAAHNYTSKVTTAATCTTAGVKTFTCSACGKSYTEAIKATGHSYTSKVTTAATCTTAGVKTFTCSNCKDSYTQPIAATGHSYVNGSCSACGAKDPNAGTSTEGYVQVTDVNTILKGGKFVIVAYVNGAYKALNVTLSSGKFVAVDVTVADGIVTGDSLPVWNIAAADGGVTLSNDNGFLNYNSSTNFKFDDVEYVWTVTAGENGFVLDAVETTRGIYYQLSSNKFGAYATSNATSGGYVSQLMLFKYQTASAACSHSYTSKVTTAATCTKAGVTTYTCSKCGDSYTEEIAATGHSFTGSTCTVCGTKVDFYLFGFINGANYGCEEDAENMGVYKFVDGKLTTSFTQDSYIAVKTTGNASWYMTKAYVEGKNAVLHNTNTGASEKMFIPGGVTVTFTLTENENGTLSLNYVTGGVLVPTLTLNYPSLSFEDEILYNVYYTIDNTASVVEMGLVTFSTRLTNGSVDNALEIIPGYQNSGSTYMVQSNGIPAKNLGDALYFKVYAKLSDGSYVYSDIAGYHAAAYAKTVLGDANSSAKAKALVVAMLNYGAAAQTYFNYKTNALMNASLTTEQQALVKAYDSGMVADVVKADTAKAGMFVMNGGYSNIWPTVSFEGAFAINFYFTPSKTVGSTPVLYYWDEATYNSVSTLTVNNATGKITMTKDGNNYGAAIEGIAAKDMDKTIYVAGVYTSNGIPCPTSIISYSLGQYCKSIAASDSFGAATAVYGYYAKAFFA